VLIAQVNLNYQQSRLSVDALFVEFDSLCYAHGSKSVGVSHIEVKSGEVFKIELCFLAMSITNHKSQVISCSNAGIVIYSAVEYCET